MTKKTFEDSQPRREYGEQPQPKIKPPGEQKGEKPQPMVRPPKTK